MITLKENESIRRIVRKHWFVLIGEIFLLVLGYALPFFAYVYYTNRIAAIVGGGTALPPIESSVAVFLVALWTLFLWTRTAAVFTDYYLDVLIVTDERLIDIEQKGFFNREVATLPVARVQDVTVRVRGIIATLLDFGEVHVQTAGAAREFIIEGIPRPREIKELILHEHAAAVLKKQQDVV